MFVSTVILRLFVRATGRRFIARQKIDQFNQGKSVYG